MATIKGRIRAISISKKRGTQKTNVPEAELKIDFGIIGDAHADHWHRQISLLAIESIQKMVAQHFLISREQLLGNSRKKEVAKSRHIAIYLCKQYTSSSLKTIGLNFGGRDHSTVIHSIHKVETEIKNDQEFSKLILYLGEKVKNAD